MLSSLLLTSGGSTAAGEVATAITNVDMSGLLTEILGLLPVVLPVIIGFLAVRKGISFLIGSLRRA